MAGEKTEAPTQRRRDDARKRGQVSKSQELVSIGVLLITVIGFRVVGPDLWEGMSGLLREDLTRPAARGDLTPHAAMGLWRDAIAEMFLTFAPLIALVALAGVALNIGQTGFLLNASGIKPKFSAINPGAGVKRIFSAEGFAGLLKALAKMGVVAIVVTMTMRSQMAEIATLGQQSIPTATAHMAQLSFDISLRAVAVLFVLALLDFAWQRRRFISQLKMTKQEVRQEVRESDGDPQVKAAIRRRRQQMMSRMISAVPTADVVVTNPTHYAVAIKYDPVGMQAPMVVAKGERLLAQRIKELARKNGVPVVEEPPLARALYRAVPVGHYIPAQLFHAVAEVLAWVYALRAKTSGRRPAPARAGV